MNQIKKAVSLFGLFVIMVLSVAMFTHPARAEQNWTDGMRIERGFYAQSSSFTVTTAQLIFDFDIKRPDNLCRNNTAATVWLGATSSSATASWGFPVLSSETFNTGSFISQVWASCDSGTCDIRCWTGKTR